jgi:hypothetical protein
MASARKKTPSKPVKKLRDLKPKKDPRGGNVTSNSPTKTYVPQPEPTKPSWID